MGARKSAINGARQNGFRHFRRTSREHTRGARQWVAMGARANYKSDTASEEFKNVCIGTGRSGNLGVDPPGDWPPEIGIGADRLRKLYKRGRPRSGRHDPDEQIFRRLPRTPLL